MKDKDPEPVAKKPYSPPRLVVYGDLRTITENKMRTGNDSSGVGGSNFSV
jgi:hypothetical protein